MDFELDFILNYPAIIPVGHEKDAYHGYLFVGGDGYPISTRRDASGKFTLDMTRKLEPHSLKVEQLLDADYAHVVQLLNALTRAILEAPKAAPVAVHTELWRRVLQEYAEFRSFHFNADSSLSPDLQVVNMSYEDEARRRHEVVVGVNYAANEKLFAVTGADMPEGCTFKPENSLLGLYGKFVSAVQQYQAFFDWMDQIDGQCWVIDPDVPKRSDCYRRIVLGDNISIVVTFDALKLQQVPLVKVLGPRNQTNLIYEKLLANSDNWDVCGDILEEMFKLLDITEFPSKPERNDDHEVLLVSSEECCICFSLRLDGKLPEIVCGNASCSRFFHQDCLYKWLCTLNLKKFYVDICGLCPNCEKPISCPIP